MRNRGCQSAMHPCGRMTAYPEVIPKKCGSVRVGDDPLMTKEEGSVQLADAAWTLRGAFAKSHSINFPHPGGSGRQVTYNPVFRALLPTSLVCSKFRFPGRPLCRSQFSVGWST